MNAAQLAQRLLVYTDQRTLSEANTAGAEYIQSAVDAVNSAAQELYRLAPAIAERRYGLATRAPATLTIDAVTGSATATILSGWQSWMVGQALRSPMPVNRIFSEQTSTLTLQNQFPFTQNALAATIYNDAIPLPAEIVKILPDVVVDDSVFLQPANTEAQLNSIITLQRTSDYGRPYPFRRRAIPSEPGIPAAYMVDTIGSSATGAAPQRYLRLSPWPVAAHSVSFTAKVKPIPVTVASIDAANNGAACTTEVPVPMGWDETYLLPIALQHFTGSPFWNNQGAAQEIARRYQQAITDLPMGHPQSHRPTAIYPAV